MKIKVSKYISEFFVKHGIVDCFMVTGGGSSLASLRYCPKYTNTSSGMIAHLYYILSCVRESYHHPITRIDMCLSCTFER